MRNLNWNVVESKLRLPQSLHLISHSTRRADSNLFMMLPHPNPNLLHHPSLSHREHSVILTFPVIAVDSAQTRERVCRYTSHSAALTSGCCCSHTTRPLSA